MQSRRGSMLEVLISTGLGFIIAMITTAIALPAFGHNVTLHQNFWITVIFTVVSLARSYLLRRLFNRITVRRLQNAPGN